MAKELEADDIELKEYAFAPSEIEMNGTKVVDYTAVEHDKIFLANKKSILEKERPSWIPALDELDLKTNSFLPACARDKATGDYYVLNNSTVYKMSLDLLAASVDYYLKKERERIKKEGKRESVLLPRGLKTMSRKRYNEILSLLPFCSCYKEELEKHGLSAVNLPRNSDAYRRQNTIVFIEQYHPLLEAVKGKKLDLNYSKQDYIDSYSKGEETSYGNSGCYNNLYAAYGIKIKKQNGSTFSKEQLERINESVGKVWSHYGNLHNVASGYGLKVSYADNCMQHARQKAVGLFTPYYNAIGVSFFDEEKQLKIGALHTSDVTLSHEAAHWLDAQKGKELHRFFASDADGTLENRIASAFKEEIKRRARTDRAAVKLGKSDGQPLGDYWFRTCECFARAMEQSYAMKQGIDLSVEKTYASGDVFKKDIEPLIADLMAENSRHFGLEKIETQINEKENEIMKKNEEFSFFVKDTAEFEQYADFEPATNLTAAEAMEKLAEQKRKGFSAGIGINIPDDFIFDDLDGNGSIVFQENDGKLSFNMGDNFIKELKESNGHARNVIAAFKALDEAVKKSSAYSDGLYIEPDFLYEKERELFGKEQAASRTEQSAGANKTIVPHPVSLEEILAVMDMIPETTPEGKTMIYDQQRQEYLSNDSLFSGAGEDNLTYNNAKEVIERLDTYIHGCYFNDMQEQLEAAGVDISEAESLQDLCELYRTGLENRNDKLSIEEYSLAMGIVYPDTLIMPAMERKQNAGKEKDAVEKDESAMEKSKADEIELSVEQWRACDELASGAKMDWWFEAYGSDGEIHAKVLKEDLKALSSGFDGALRISKENGHIVRKLFNDNGIAFNETPLLSAEEANAKAQNLYGFYFEYNPDEKCADVYRDSDGDFVGSYGDGDFGFAGSLGGGSSVRIPDEIFRDVTALAGQFFHECEKENFPEHSEEKKMTPGERYNALIDEGIEQTQANSGMSAAAMEADANSLGQEDAMDMDDDLGNEIVDTVNLNGRTFLASEVERLLKEDISAVFRELDSGENEQNLVLNGVKIYGNPEKDGKIKLLAEFDSRNPQNKWREDALFNAISDEKLTFSGIEVDVNPITPEKSGTIEQYLERLEENGHLYEKQAQAEENISKEALNENQEIQAGADKEKQAVSLSDMSVEEPEEKKIDMAIENISRKLDSVSEPKGKVLPFSVINNIEKGRVNIRFDTVENNPDFQSIIKELKANGWKFAPSARQWYPVGRAVEGAEKFAGRLQEKYSVSLNKSAELSMDVSSKSSPYDGIRFFDRNYNEAEEFSKYFNEHILELDDAAHGKLSEKDAAVILRALGYTNAGVLENRSNRLGLDKENNLVVLEKKCSDVKTFATDLNGLLDIAKERAENSVEEAHKALENYRTRNKIPDKELSDIFVSMYEECIRQGEAVNSRMKTIYEIYRPGESMKNSRSAKRDVKKPAELSLGDKIGRDTVTDLFRISDGVYQAALAQKDGGTFSAGSYFVLDRQITEQLSSGLQELLDSFGDRSVINNKNYEPYILRSLIEKGLIPPRDDDFVHNLDEFISAHPLKYEKLKPVDYLNFEKKLKEIAEVDKAFNKSPFELGQQLVALVNEGDRPKLMVWLKQQGCDSEEHMEKVFSSWLNKEPEQKKEQNKKKESGYPPRGEN